MEIEKLILKELNNKGKLKVSDIVSETGFSRSYIHRFFQELKNQGKITLIGKANRAFYVLAKKENIEKEKERILEIHKFMKNINLFEDTVLAQIKKESGIFDGLTQNISRIIDYTFTEMLNNAIEHSNSAKIKIFMKRDTGISFKVRDWGIGIFANIKKKRKLINEIEAIQDLLKGKQTTAPAEHTGEGIFFTSKLADKLIIKSHKKKLIFDNKLNDIFIKDIKELVGTEVSFVIDNESKKELEKIFREYTSDSLEFFKTKVIVDLYKMDNIYISRSQARRVLAGLDKFKVIILDFKNVETVGQGFADEVFRVWQELHPKIKINYQNANENIEFMIKRSLANK